MVSNKCSEYEFYSESGGICVQCEAFCRIYPLECSKTPECEKYRADLWRNSMPTWATALIVVFCLLLLLAIGLILSIKYRKRLCRFCKVSCMFNFKKKRSSSRGKESELRVPYQTKVTWTNQDPVRPSLPYDIDAIRKMTIMERFFASIEQHPPQLGVEELEPLSTEAQRLESELDPKLTNDKKLQQESSDIDSECNEAQSLVVRPVTHLSRPPRRTLDNRDILENYHLQRASVKRDQDPRPEVHPRPRQTGRRTGLNQLINPRTGASQTTV